MIAKKKRKKKVMEEKRPSLPEVVTVRKRPRTPGVTLNRLKMLTSASAYHPALKQRVNWYAGNHPPQRG